MSVRWRIWRPKEAFEDEVCASGFRSLELGIRQIHRELCLLVEFVVQDAETVDVRSLFWGIAMPRDVLDFGVLLIGACCGWLLRATARDDKDEASSAP